MQVYPGVSYCAESTMSRSQPQTSSDPYYLKNTIKDFNKRGARPKRAMIPLWH